MTAPGFAFDGIKVRMRQMEWWLDFYVGDFNLYIECGPFSTVEAATNYAKSQGWRDLERDLGDRGR